MKTYNVKLNVYATYNYKVTAPSDSEAQEMAGNYLQEEIDEHGIRDFDIDTESIEEIKKQKRKLHINTHDRKLIKKLVKQLDKRIAKKNKS